MIASGTVANAAANGTLFAMPDVREDDVADQLGARPTHERRRDVVAEREREREDRAGGDPGHRERHDDPSERHPALAPRSEDASRYEPGMRSSAA